MKQENLNQKTRECLRPFLSTEWITVPIENLGKETEIFNKKEDIIKITEVTASLSFAKGPHDTNFFLKEYSLKAEMPEIGGKFQTEYMGALCVHLFQDFVLSTSWHGCSVIIMNKVEACFENYSLSKTEIDFFKNVSQALSKL